MSILKALRDAENPTARLATPTTPAHATLRMGAMVHVSDQSTNRLCDYPDDSCLPATPSLLLIDPFARDRGHLLQDDLFLSKCLQPLAGRFLVATSPTSVANLHQHVDVPTLEFPWHGADVVGRWRMARVLATLPCGGFRDIVFQSFEEVSTLLFMLRHPRQRVHLIVTNNLRPDRFTRRPILSRLVLRQVFQRAASVIVHCEHEVETVQQLVPGIDATKVKIKPFHQFAQPRMRLALPEKKPTILYVGPEMPHKPLEPVIQLARQDTGRLYRYVLCSMQDLAPATARLIESQSNIELIRGYQNEDEFYRLISEASLVILTHGGSFAGALSGVFCDAIASGTAVVAQDMPPHNEFFKRFGPMGFLVDYDDPAWPRKLLGANLPGLYDGFQRSMTDCRHASRRDAIREVFRAVLERQ